MRRYLYTGKQVSLGVYTAGSNLGAPDIDAENDVVILGAGQAVL